jgi:GNAT superfamily N-acetyltransferase
MIPFVNGVRLAIRPARPEDRDGVWALVRDFATTFVPERARFDRSFDSLTSHPLALVVVAAAPTGELVGYALAHQHLTFLANGPVVWVEEVMVDAAVRRHGVGRALMAHVERWAAAGGAAYVALATRRAAPFYHALGYEDSAVFFRKLITP